MKYIMMATLMLPIYADYVCGTINGTKYCSGDDGSWTEPNDNTATNNDKDKDKKENKDATH